jgi:CspA family cold shock protein
MSSSKESVTLPKATSSEERLIGRVKWFNNKAGYGFVTVTDGSQSGTDIFVHHSAIGVSSQQYKYLVQGEYIEFSITATQNSTHAFQASSICGIKGGKLMCETRNEFKLSRTNYKSSDTQTHTETTCAPVKMPRQQRPPNRDYTKDVEQKEWTLIKGNKCPEHTHTPVSQPTSAGPGRGGGGRGTSSGRGRGRPRTTQAPN